MGAGTRNAQIRALDLLAAAVVLVSVLLAAWLVLSSSSRNRDDATTRLERDTLRFATAGENLDEYVGAVRSLLQVLALRPGMVSATDAVPEDLDAAFRILRARHGLTGLLVSIPERNGGNAAPRALALGAVTPAERRLQDAHRRRFTVAPVPEFLFDSTGADGGVRPGARRTGFVASVPLRREDRPLGVVSGMIPADHLAGILKPGDDEGVIALVGRTGEVLAGEAPAGAGVAANVAENWRVCGFSADQSYGLIGMGNPNSEPRGFAGRSDGWSGALMTLATGLVLGLLLRTVRSRLLTRLRTLKERARDEELLQAVAKGTSGATGEEFFRVLGRSLAKAFEVRYAFVSRLDESHPEMAETLAFWDGDDFRPRIHYRVEGTPSERILQQGRYVAADGVDRDFAEDDLLHSMRVCSYAGTTLYDSEGEPCGVLVVMDTAPFRQPRQRVDSILQLFAARAAAELIRLRSERRIKLMNEELERRVDARSQELREAQGQLVEAEKLAALGTLVAGVAHEINGPVGIGVTAVTHLQDQLRSFSDLYRNGGVTRGGLEHFLDGVRESTGLVFTNLKRAADLVTVFKKVTADGGGEESRSCRPRDLVRQVLHDMDSALDRGGHRVELDCPAETELMTYPTVFRGLIAELLKNSLSHGFQGRREGRIHIAIEDMGPSWRLCYEDDGCGMASEVQARIFDPFFTTQRHRSATGLGMHIVYNAVTRTLGGTVRCRSEAGGGARFDVVCPQAGPEAVRSADEPALLSG